MLHSLTALKGLTDLKRHKEGKPKPGEGKRGTGEGEAWSPMGPPVKDAG